jgi:hypothetical protein
MRDSIREARPTAHATACAPSSWPAPADSVRTVDVAVNEHRTRRPGHRGFNTFDFVQANGRFTHYNFFGGAAGSTVATLGNLFAESLNGSRSPVIGFQDVTADVVGEAEEFLKPTYHGEHRLQATVAVVAEKRGGRRRVRASAAGAGVFVERGEGANVSFTREVADRVPVSLSYRFELTGVVAGDVYFCVNYGVCDPQTIAALRERQRLSPCRSRQREPAERSAGAEPRVRRAGALRPCVGVTGSSYRYNSAYLEGAAYRPGAKSIGARRACARRVRARAGEHEPSRRVRARTSAATSCIRARACTRAAHGRSWRRREPAWSPRPHDTAEQARGHLPRS